MGIIFYFMNFFDFLVKKVRKKHFFMKNSLISTLAWVSWGLGPLKQNSDPTFPSPTFYGDHFLFYEFFWFFGKKNEKKAYFNFELQILIKNSFKSKKFRSLTPIEIQFYLLGGVFREIFIIRIAETRQFYRIDTKTQKQFYSLDIST